ncbi:MAG: hypothetical protein ACPIB0_08835 [Akkermansiaceae bacterium]
MSCISRDPVLNTCAMFDAKQLSDHQVQSVRDWAADGAQLADIQKRLEEEMELRLSYMDTRFLILDLGVEIRNLAKEEAESSQVEEPASIEPGSEDDKMLSEDDLEVLPPPSQGKVTVTVDGIARPGLMASGRVTFGDGKSGIWYVDEMGRLGIDPEEEGYRPGEADILAFQRELQAVMEAR